MESAAIRNGIFLPNCSDLILEKNVLVIKKIFLRSLEQFIRTVKGQNNFW